ncbi:MAG TPA: hypothetical protein VF916_14165 [Ktedonobacterales bacterium]
MTELHGQAAMLEQWASGNVATMLHFTLARYMMKISLRRALKFAAVASAITFGALWLPTVLFDHFDPLASAIGSVLWAVFVFAGVLTGLWFGFGPFTRE